MEKLKELISKNDSEQFGYSTGISKFSKLTPDIIRKSTEYDNYKGYRFFDELFANYRIISIVMADRPFIIGTIRLHEHTKETKNVAKEVLNIFKLDRTNYHSVAHVKIHETFKGKGIGFILYEYVIKKYSMLMSDTDLFYESYKMWSQTLPKRLNSPVFGMYYVNPNVWSVQLVQLLNESDSVTRFVAFSSSKLLYDKIFSVCKYIKKNYSDYQQVVWLPSNTGKTETLKSIRHQLGYEHFGLTEQQMFNLSDNPIVKAYIVVGKNYMVLVKKDLNNKFKVVNF